MLQSVVVLLALFICVNLAYSIYARRRDMPSESQFTFLSKSKKPQTNERWVQVYDTDSDEEAEQIRARLQEENLEVVIYEQGRKDVHGNALKGFGVAVPRTQVSRAQNVISRMPV